MKSKKRTVVILMVVFVIIVGVISICIYHKSEKNKDEVITSNSISESIKGDITKTLDEILDCKFNEIYAQNKYGTPFTISNAEETIYPIIFERVTYEITNIDKKNHTATLIFQCPDIYKMLNNIEDEETEITKENLYEKVKKTEMTEKEVTVNLDYISEHWYIIVDGYFVDALTGGMISLYADTEYDAYQRLLNE